MWKHESKLTKYTLIGCALLMIAYFSTSARADETEDIIQIASICAATSIFLASESDDEIDRVVLVDEGQWWREFLIAFTADEASANASITAIGSGINDAHEDGTLNVNMLKQMPAQCVLAREELVDE